MNKLNARRIETVRQISASLSKPSRDVIENLIDDYELCVAYLFELQNAHAKLLEQGIMGSISYSNSDKWMDKPDGDGFYAVGNGLHEHVICVNGDFCRAVVDHGHVTMWGCVVEVKDLIGRNNKFYKLTVTHPAPYKEPSPPQVIQYTAILKNGARPKRYLTRVGELFHVHDQHGVSMCNTAEKWKDVASYYDEIEEIKK